MANIKWDIDSVAAAVKPGVQALVACQLDDMVADAVAAAEKHLHERLVGAFAAEIEVAVQRALDYRMGDEVKVTIDCTFNGEKNATD